jgi:uroporphyrinogen decarboxylase
MSLREEMEMEQAWTRRDFIESVGIVTASLAVGCAGAPSEETPITNKREALLGLLDPNRKQDYVPAAFFLHFDEVYHRGEPAIEKHLEYFRYTGMDFVKIQYEVTFPPIPEIETPADWVKMPLYKEDLYEAQLKVVEGIVKRAKEDALVLVTLYSPFMCAGQTVGPERLTAHIKEDPEQVKRGMEVITESLLLFVKGCVGAGVDGFYASTQGGESFRFDDRTLFEECVKPYDLTIMEEINRSCIFNILHVCDYHGGYDDLTPFLDYPGDVVNCSLKVGADTMTPRQASSLFGRPFMGGMERKGVIAGGSEDEIRKAAEDVLSEAPDRFILGADCTVPNDTPWDNLRTAITTAHRKVPGTKI